MSVIVQMVVLVVGENVNDRGGKEDKAREQILSSAEQGYKERDTKEKLGLIKEMPEWSKERREKSKQKRQWL